MSKQPQTSRASKGIRQALQHGAGEREGNVDGDANECAGQEGKADQQGPIYQQDVLERGHCHLGFVELSDVEDSLMGDCCNAARKARLGRCEQNAKSRSVRGRHEAARLVPGVPDPGIGDMTISRRGKALHGKDKIHDIQMVG